jgi:hypothetical protein
VRKWITTELMVSRKRGSDVQRLVKITRLFGKRIGATVVDHEIIPPDVMITLGCFGDPGEWKSKFAHITEAWPKAS